MPELATDAVQLRTATFVVLFGVQVVATQEFPDEAGLATQEATPLGPDVMGAGQVVVTQLFPEVAAAAVQLATGTLVVVIGAGQVVVV